MKCSAFILAATLIAAHVSLADDETVRGVNPADNLTKFEILPKFSMVDAGGDVSVSTMTFKYDRAFDGIFGVNFELPFAYFDSPFTDESGIGDFNLRGRYQHRAGNWAFIAGIRFITF
jgi:hypothetical protein